MSDDLTSWKRATESARRSAERGREYKSLWDRSIPGRATNRYVLHNGNVLAGGVAYYSLASVAAALVLGVSVASIIVIGNEALREAVIDFVSHAIPGLFPEGDDPGLIDPATLEPSTINGVVGLISFGVLIYTATRYFGSLRRAVRRMLGDAAGSARGGIVWDFLALIGLALIALLGATVQVIATGFASFFARLLGGDGASQVLVWAPALLIAFIANCAFVGLVFLVLGRSRVRVRVLVPTIAVTAGIIVVLQQLSSYFVAQASANPVLALFAPVIALLLFVDFVARAILMAAAFMGDVYDQHRVVVAGGPGALPSPARRGLGGVTTRRATGFDKTE